jgi:tetratricopeptide (TPR) repeat protein
MAGEIERRIHAHPGDNELRAARLVQGWLNPIQRPDPPQLLRDLAPACSSVAALLNESFGLRCTSVEPMAEALIFMRAGNLDKAWASLQRVPETSLALRLMATFLKMDQCKARQLGPCQFEPGQFGLQGAALAQANAQLRLLQASRLIELPSAQRPALLEDLRLVFGADSSSACQNLWGASPCESTMPQLTAVLEFEGARLAGRLAADHVIAASLCERAHRALPDSTGTLQCHAGALQRQGRFEQARTVWLASLAIDSRSKANALVPAFLSAGETHLGLAELDLQLGRWASAQKHLDQAKAAEDTSTTKSYWIADALVDSRASLALRQCQRGVTKHARSGPSGVLSSAMQAAQEGRWEEVRQAAQHVLETADMSDPSHEILLARAEFGLGHADVAMRRLRSTIKRWPEAYDAPRWLYHMRRQSGAWALAGDDAERKLLKLSGRYVQAMDQGALVESRDMYQDFDDMNYFHDCRLQPVGVRRASAAGPGRDVHRAGQLRRPHRTGP